MLHVQNEIHERVFDLRKTSSNFTQKMFATISFLTAM